MLLTIMSFPQISENFLQMLILLILLLLRTACWVPVTDSCHSLSGCYHCKTKSWYMFMISGKIGYGTFSEALAYKLPFVFVRRDFFNEEPFLRNMLEVLSMLSHVSFHLLLIYHLANLLTSNKIQLNSTTNVALKWLGETFFLDIGYHILNVLLLWNHAIKEAATVVRYSFYQVHSAFKENSCSSCGFA